MGDVVQLKKPGESWTAGPMRCLRCKHEWGYARKLPDEIVDCPECGCNAGVPAGTFTGRAEIDAVWTCICQNTLLQLLVTPKGRQSLLCIGCGRDKEVNIDV